MPSAPRIQEIENATLPGAEDEANEAKFVKPLIPHPLRKPSLPA